MKFGMVKVASVSPKNVYIGNPDKNSDEIIILTSQYFLNYVLRDIHVEIYFFKIYFKKQQFLIC